MADLMNLSALVLAALVGGDDWQYRPELGYVNVDTMERKSPRQFYDYGVSLRERGDADEAIAAFELISAHGPDAQLREWAFFRRAEAMWSAARYQDAHHAFAAFVTRYPESPQAENAKVWALECGYRLTVEGDPQTFFGLVTVTSTWRTGAQILRDFLRRYPLEKRSGEYHFKLAEFFVAEGEDAEAEAELTILVQSRDTVYAGKALILLGEVHLRRFKGVSYDVKPLLEAKRHFRRYLDEMRERDKKLADHVTTEVRRIDALQAEKDIRIAEYYDSRGYPKAAKIYYSYVLKTYPATEWATRAQRRIEELAKGE